MAQTRHKYVQNKARRFTHSTETHEKTFMKFFFQIECKTSK
jgi:hypothetical protein